MKHVISDTHFSHGNIIKYCNRPFVDAYGKPDPVKMNRALISNWNRVVSKDDIVFHVGDFAFGPRFKWSDIRAELNGKIVLILGNHDEDEKFMKLIGIEEVYEDKIIHHNGVTIYLNHYPTFDKQIAQYHLYGHVHDKTPENQPVWARNMSVELNGYTPIPLDRIVSDFQLAELRDSIF